MKYLVTYWSQTGNTKKVAEAIYNALPGEKFIGPYDKVENLDGFDLTFIGFPIMQFGLPTAAKKFLAAHAAGKKIALFITHAMLSNPGNQQQQIMLEKELEKCRSSCSASILTGSFHCQGELSEKTASELISTEIPMLMEFASMRALTIGHPDPEELVAAGTFAKKIITL